MSREGVTGRGRSRRAGALGMYRGCLPSRLAAGAVKVRTGRGGVFGTCCTVTLFHIHPFLTPKAPSQALTLSPLLPAGEV